jgi:hypothetical protein
MNWRCLDLQHTQDEELDPMWRAAWKAACADASPEIGNAVFRRRGDVPAMYFSPAAVELADAFGASECDEPSPEGLHLVAGLPGAWAACFPGVPEPAAPQREALAAAGEQGEDFQQTIPSKFDDSFRPTIPSVL